MVTILRLQARVETAIVVEIGHVHAPLHVTTTIPAFLRLLVAVVDPHGSLTEMVEAEIEGSKIT